MPRKKKKIVSMEVLEINSMWDYRNSKALRNFVCYEEDVEDTVKEMDTKETWKHEKDYEKQLKRVLAPSGTRNASNSLYSDDVAYEEVKLPSTIKPATKYIYKVYDYCDGKVSSEYGTQKDALAYINKKIKTKSAYVSYNGRNGRIEYSQKAVGEILGWLEDTTSQFSIEPLGRSGDTGEMILVSIFKNRLK